ncbi:hypothetical protein ACT4S2_17075 [Kocuria turfanensis]|uniref:hypothetical protein n=1 Tax=Kocuria turfanensis TaxID=388357 RepID=UPI004035C456
MELEIEHGLVLEGTEADRWNPDGLEQPLELPAAEEICTQLLHAWHLYGDIARSPGATLEDDGEKAQRCYDELFYGNTLPSITPVGERLRPFFTDAEQQLIGGIPARGRAVLATHL